MSAPVVSREVAEAEINEWLDAKKVFPSTREDHEDMVETMIEGMMYGVLSFDKETKVLNHKLLFPLGDVTSLNYRHRINDKELKKWMKGVDNTDGVARLNATIAALTDTARGIIEGLDTMDKKVSNAIATFFF